jgi:hypothetical protein
MEYVEPRAASRDGNAYGRPPAYRSCAGTGESALRKFLPGYGVFVNVTLFVTTPVATSPVASGGAGIIVANCLRMSR